MTAYIIAATQTWIDRDSSFRVAQCLLHFGWQASAIALAYAAVAAGVRRGTANARYGAGVVALAVMVLCLPATFLVLTKWSHNHYSSVLAKPDQGENDSADVPSSPVNGISAVAAKSVVSIDRDDSHEQLDTASAMSDLRTVLFSCAPYISTFYVGGVLIMLSRLILGVSESRRWQRSAHGCDATVRKLVAVCCRRLGLRAVPLVAYCERVSAPLVVGVIKPIILIPAVLATGLSGKQLELVLLHELAHIRRFDVAINLLQRLIESVLFFHPAVWWVSGRVRLERENACDDMALSINREGGICGSIGESRRIVFGCYWASAKTRFWTVRIAGFNGAKPFAIQATHCAAPRRRRPFHGFDVTIRCCAVRSRVCLIIYSARDCAYAGTASG